MARTSLDRESTPAAERPWALAPTGMLVDVPAPTNERRQLELELAERPAQIAALRQELENGRPLRARRGRCWWTAENLERRRLALRARLATLPREPRS